MWASDCVASARSHAAKSTPAESVTVSGTGMGIGLALALVNALHFPAILDELSAELLECRDRQPAMLRVLSPLLAEQPQENAGGDQHHLQQEHGD
jgi:hypothetical protein